MSIENTLMAEPKIDKNKIGNITEEEMAAIKDVTTRDVEAKFSGNPAQKYTSGTLENTDESYIKKVAEEVDRLMSDPEYVEKLRAHLADINRPDRSWN
jgi:hypothetical protein